MMARQCCEGMDTTRAVCSCFGERGDAAASLCVQRSRFVGGKSLPFLAADVLQHRAGVDEIKAASLKGSVLPSARTKVRPGCAAVRNEASSIPTAVRRRLCGSQA